MRSRVPISEDYRTLARASACATSGCLLITRLFHWGIWELHTASASTSVSNRRAINLSRGAAVTRMRCVLAEKQKMPVRNVLGNFHVGERALQTHDLRAGHALLDAGEKTIVHVLPNSFEAFVPVELIKGNKPA